MWLGTVRGLVYLKQSRCYSCINKNPNLANTGTPCFPQLHVEGSKIATEINATLFVSCVILIASKLWIKYAEYSEVSVLFAPGGNLQELRPLLFQFVDQIALTL